MVRALLSLSCLLFVAACQTRPTVGPELRPIETVKPQILSREELDKLDAEPLPAGEFDRESLFALLQAEFEGNSQNYEQLLENYLMVARRTRDQGIIARAYSAAQFLKREEAVTEMLLLWAEVDPNNVEVQQQAALVLVSQGRFDEALRRMEQVLDMEGNASFSRIAIQARRLDPASRKELIALYEDVLRRHPDNRELRYGYAVLLQQTGQAAEALEVARALLEEAPEEGSYITLTASLLKATAGNEVFTRFLQDHEALLLNDQRLGNFYGRALIESGNMEEAQNVYAALARNFPEASHIRLSLALVSIENKDFENATKLLDTLIEDAEQANEARFYRARLAEMQKDQDKAIALYRQVNAGGHYFNSLARAAFLLVQQGQDAEGWTLFRDARAANPSQALELWELEINLLNELKREQEALERAGEALAAFPESNEILYIRAMLHERRGDLESMETDLRQVLAAEPENTAALNALGYTLADRTDRLEEAAELIEKAYALNPDNPAVIDSKGWLLYRQQKPEQALPYLERAHASFPDPEVAAHLGEVLWVTGEQERALTIFAPAWQKEPNHRVLKETIERLQIDTQLLEPETSKP